MRIVICDAHRVFADALASLLRAAGHEIAGSVLDLDQATELLSREPIEACVIDLRAPDPGKRPEIEKVVAGFPDTAFIALSGSADPSSLRHAMTSGVQGVAMKGDDFGEFVRVLTEAVANRGSSRAQVLSSSARAALRRGEGAAAGPDRKSTRLNSSHTIISYAVFCLRSEERRVGKECRSRWPSSD